MPKIHTTFAQWIVALAAAGSLLVSALNFRQISDVHILINSRMSELLELTKTASKAEGVKEGREEIPH